MPLCTSCLTRCPFWSPHRTPTPNPSTQCPACTSCSKMQGRLIRGRGDMPMISSVSNQSTQVSCNQPAKYSPSPSAASNTWTSSEMEPLLKSWARALTIIRFNWESTTKYYFWSSRMMRIRPTYWYLRRSSEITKISFSAQWRKKPSPKSAWPKSS